MSTTVKELYLGRSIRGADRERSYLIRGTTDEEAARAAMIAYSPDYVGSLVRDAGGLDIEQFGPSEWMGRIVYVPVEKKTEPEVNDSRFTFEITGGSRHAKWSLETVASYPPGDGDANPPKPPPPNFGRMINVSRDSDAAGVSLPPEGRHVLFNETHWKSIAEVDDAYLRTLSDLQFTVAASKFRRWEIGECLFLGASGQRSGSELWEITYQFAISSNATGLTVGADITGVDKKGWEYLWAYSIEVEDEEAKTITRKLRSAYVERVFEYGDFSRMNIGG